MLTKRYVIKIGTNILTDTHQRLDLNNMRHLVQQISKEIQNSSNIECIIVSSGAITCGSKHMNMSIQKLNEKQAAASIGQILLFKQYFDFFQSNGLCAAQLLITKDNLNHPEKTKNIQDTIHTLLDHGVIPIINENDSVSTEEIQFGDNDQLSAQLATKVHADHLIILTNADGVLDSNHNVIPHLTKITDNELSLVQDQLSSPYSKGGMRSKLMAAKLAIEHHIPVTIANGRTENIIHQLFNKVPVGTHISLS
tara:strand:+ start:1607 stop:2365 length:759 start_codon:yes stop_codon:yes gene_type:complete